MKPFHIQLLASDQASILSSFESATERLKAIDRLYLEPDGSFVWTGPEDEQLHGMIYDDQTQIRYVEMRGRCTLNSWRRVVRAIDASLLEKARVISLPSLVHLDLHTFEKSSFSLDDRWSKTDTLG